MAISQADILSKRVLTIGNYEYPKIMIKNGVWEYCNGRPVFVISTDNLAQKYLDDKVLQPEVIVSDCIHAVKSSQNEGGTLYMVTSNVYLTLSQIDSLTHEELCKVFLLPLKTIEHIKDNLVVRDNE